MAAERQPHYRERISRDPAILAGKPVVSGTRIPVALVLAKLAYTPDLTELFVDYPRLTMDDVKACLEYARELVEHAGEVQEPSMSPSGSRVHEVPPR